MDLSPVKTSTTPVDEKLWLGSKHGTDCPRTVTLDVDAGGFTVVSDPQSAAGYGYIPSGTPIIKGGGDLYVQAPADAPCDGHLLESVRVTADTTHAGGSLHWHGVVVAAQVPLAGFDGATDGAPHILYV